MTEAEKYLLGLYNAMNLPNKMASAYSHVTLSCMWDDIRHGMREKLAELGVEAPPIEPWSFIYPQDRDSEEEAFILTPPLAGWKMPPAPMCPVCNVPAIPMIQIVSPDECGACFECPNVANEESDHDALADLLPGDEALIEWPFDRPALNQELEALGFTIQHV